MPTRMLASLTTAASLVLAAAPALAQTASQTAPMNSDEAAAQSSGSSTDPNATSSTATTTTAGHQDELLMSHGVSYSVGWRFWVHGIPGSLVGLFVHAENQNGAGWGGTYVNVATGPEFVYRKDNLDIALGVMYVGYNAPTGFFRASNDPLADTEMIGRPITTSEPNGGINIWGAYLTSHFLWGIRLHRMFEIQVGVGIGIGYIGGDLPRSQVYQDGAGHWQDCGSSSNPQSFCQNNPNNHFTANNYNEATWANGGSMPIVLPWISLPQVGFHFRPHRNFDVRADVGYGLITVYGGLSAHYVF